MMYGDAYAATGPGSAGGQDKTDSDSPSSDAPIIALGLQKEPLGTLQAASSKDVSLEVLPLSLGVHALPPLSVIGQHDQHVYDVLPLQYLQVTL